MLLLSLLAFAVSVIVAAVVARVAAVVVPVAVTGAVPVAGAIADVFVPGSGMVAVCGLFWVLLALARAVACVLMCFRGWSVLLLRLVGAGSCVFAVIVDVGSGVGHLVAVVLAKSVLVLERAAVTASLRFHLASRRQSSSWFEQWLGRPAPSGEEPILAFV